MIPNILEQNIYNPDFKDKFLLIGSCIETMYPEILEKYKKKWGNCFSICLEQFHYNQLHSKLVAILSLGNTKNVGFFTVDGSPHCVQVHFVSKYLKRELKNDIEFKHYVINKNKEVFEVSLEQIDSSRDFSRIGEKKV
jgi:hypothetical protein